MMREPESANQPFIGTETRTDEVQRALLERPKFSIRMRIILSFLIYFFLVCGITAVSLKHLYQIREKQQLLEQKQSAFEKGERFGEKIGAFILEIQQARRYEKNYFLYRTNLYEAFDSVHRAHSILPKNNGESLAGQRQEALENIEQNLARYEKLLEQLVDLSKKPETNRDSEAEIAIESQLRHYGSTIIEEGSAIIEDTSAIIDEQRLAVHNVRADIQSLERSAITTSFGLLVFALVVMVYIAFFLAHHIVVRIGRMVEYTQRIAAGDFSPIKPARKYRDEFSNLAIAINRMLHEIQHRQKESVEYSKMAAVGTLTAGIAHELNNPLNNISITTEAMMEAFDDYSSEEKKKMLEDIFTQIERAGAVVRNLLDFTRAKKFSLMPLSVEEVVNSTVKLIKNEITINRIELAMNFEQNLPRINGNLQSLQQVFLNMFLNAIQAMPEKGKLTVDVRNIETDKVIRINITDSGIGIPPENLSKIFQPFFTTKNPGEGTGLGLSVSYGIIREHKGKIDVKSEVGYGTTFSVFLPYNNIEGYRIISVANEGEKIE